MNSVFRLITLLFTVSLFFTACKVQTNRAPVELIWRMGGNAVEPGVYENTFSFVNKSKKELKDNWTIYYNQQHSRLVSSDDVLHVEHLGGSYYKIKPTEHYQTLQPGDTLDFTFRARGTIIKTSMRPEGVYIVFEDTNGEEMKPLSVPVEVIPFEREGQWSRAGVAEPPFPYGDAVYEENENFTSIELKATDIFPAVKKVELADGLFRFTKDYRMVVEEDSFSGEADLLKRDLASKLGCKEQAKASTEIIIRRLSEDDSLLINEHAYRVLFDDNRIVMEAADPAGAFYASQTLLHILRNVGVPMQMPNKLIEDFPDLGHRGFMLDIVRNFTPKDKILKLIDILSSYKLNVLHLHLTDDEAWRLEIPGLEELTEIGSRRGHTTDERNCLVPAYGGGWDYTETSSTNNGFLTREDYIDILKYADERHMRVIPEVDLPGHARAAIKAMEARYYKYKDIDIEKAEEYLLSDLDDTSVYRSAQGYFDNTICVALPSVYTFVEKVIVEINDMNKEAGLKLEVFHIGGDEVPGGAWSGSEICRIFMEKNGMKETRELKDYFVQQTYSILDKFDIQIAGWQELALLPDKSANPIFSNANLLSYCWSTLPSRGNDQIPYKLANSNYPVILSNVTNFYFDMAYSRHHDEPGAYWALFFDEINSFDMLPYNIYKSVRKDLNGESRDYQADRHTKEQLNLDAREQIKGVQGQLWAETIRSYDMVEYYLFPKMFGLFERGWNASPTWENEDTTYLQELNLYRNKIYQNELKKLSADQVNFRLANPGIKIVDGKLYANTVYKEGEVRYTTDGTEPTGTSLLWSEPVECSSENIRAKVFYLGKESVTSFLKK